MVCWFVLARIGAEAAVDVTLAAESKMSGLFQYLGGPLINAFSVCLGSGGHSGVNIRFNP